MDIRLHIQASAITITMLILLTVLSSLATATMFIHQANAKVCISDSTNLKDKNNNNYVDTHITTCTHQQDSISHDHSTATKATTPFLLPVPFP
jgi:hypothetical protein